MELAFSDYALTILTAVLLAIGSLFYLIGAIGLVRMPDVFTRAHAVSVSETVGAGGLLLGMMVAAGWSLVTAKLLFILAIMLFTGSVATHALARAALTAGVVPKLAEDRVGRRNWRNMPAKREEAAIKAKASPQAKSTRKKTARKKAAGKKPAGGSSSKRS